MSKTKQVSSESAYGSLYESLLTRAPSHNWITVVIQGLIMHRKEFSNRLLHLLVSNQHNLVNHDKLRILMLQKTEDDSVRSFPYQFS